MKFQIVIKLTCQTLVVGAFLGLSLAPSWAARNSGMDELRQKVQQISSTNEKNNQEVARAINLLTQIQREFQSIRGQVQASKFLTQETDKIYQDLDLRVSALEDKIDQIHALVKVLAKPEAGGKNSANIGSQETEEFKALLNMVNARDYRGAASGFMGFMRKYPKSSYLGNAQYWIAECYYSLGDFAKSIQSFQKLVEKYPDNPRVKEGIYKQGLSFMRLKKYDEAKLFFQKVLASYPNTAEAAKAQSRLHRIEEMEKRSNQVALSDNPETYTKPEQAPPDGKTIYHPRMKPVPMPGAKRPSSSETQGTSQPEDQGEGMETETESPPNPDSSAPLF